MNTLLQTTVLQLTIAFSYFSIACVALEFSTLEAGATIIWPSAGVGLAALIRFGAKAALGVFIGAFFASVYLNNPYIITWMTALGNTLEPLLALYLLRFLPFSNNIHTLNAYASLIFAGAIGAIISAALGAPSLFFSAYIASQDIFATALQWWIGDVVGILLVAPVLLLFSLSKTISVFNKSHIELIALQILSLLIAYIVFTDINFTDFNEIRGAYLLAIPLIFSIFRFNQTITAIIVLEFFIFGVYGLLTYQGVFITEQELKLGKFLGFFSLTAAASSCASYLSNERNILYQAINNSQVETYIFYDDDLHFEFINKTALNSSNLSTKQTKKLTPFQFITPGKENEFLKQLQQLHTGKIQTLKFESIHQRNDQSSYPIEVNIQLIDSSSRYCYLALVTNISERKEKELALQKAIEVAEIANKTKSEFLANISHELRTPMHGILSFANFGIKNVASADTAKLAKYFDRINISAERLLSLINDLLDLAKLESQTVSLDLKSNNLLTTLNNCLAEQESRIQDKNLTINTDISTSNTIATYDHKGITQVISNLLSNAIKFSPSGSIILINIAQEICHQKSCLCFTIHDQGIGIPKEELLTVFDKFAQSSLTKDYSGGTGLGLAICKEIIEAHKGKISAKGSSQGCVISFKIPIKNNLPRVIEKNQH